MILQIRFYGTTTFGNGLVTLIMPARQLVPQGRPQRDPDDSTQLVVMMTVAKLVPYHATHDTPDQGPTHGISTTVAVSPHTHLLIPAGLAFDAYWLALNDGVHVHHFGVIVAIPMAAHMTAFMTVFTPVIVIPGTGLGQRCQQPDGY
jgi:hypothetical protein